MQRDAKPHAASVTFASRNQPKDPGKVAGHVQAAVEAGVLDPAAAARFLAFARQREAGAGTGPADEPFLPFRGMNEIFIISGLVILATGWTAWRLVSDSPLASAVIAAAALALLSEHFALRRRMTGPAIALTVLFALNALSGFHAFLEFLDGAETRVSVTLLCTAGAMLLWWFRCRVPFALAPAALAAVGGLLAAVAAVQGPGLFPWNLEAAFRLSSGGPLAWVTLASGLALLGGAMAFDASDPHRVTRRSQCGFWLHLVAAPLVVNTAAVTLLEGGSPWSLLCVMAVFGATAVIIDRRSFLLASGVHVAALASALTDGRLDWLVILGTGAVLLALGSFWAAVRTWLVDLLPAGFPRHLLPPVRALPERLPEERDGS